MIHHVYLQLLGAGLLAVGLWAWSEKDMFNNLAELSNIHYDPAFILMIMGAVIFIIGFFGCVGALRENKLLLLLVSACWCDKGSNDQRNTKLPTKELLPFYERNYRLSHYCICSREQREKSYYRLVLPFQYCVCVGLIFFVELIAGILLFIYRDWVRPFFFFKLVLCWSAFALPLRLHITGQKPTPPIGAQRSG